MKYISILWSYICGLCYELLLSMVHKKPLKRHQEKQHPHIVVTLTSYGRRVTDTVSHVLNSLLVQTLQPDRIILWLDNVNFSQESLPSKLKMMRDKYGVEVRFCEDIRSYKKLIPTLRLCPDDILVTVDDDLIYKPDMLQKLYHAHLETPDCVLCTLAHQPIFERGAIQPYRTWKHNITIHPDSPIFPLGGAGTLYPPHSLYSDVLDQDLFMHLAPQADDVWFWAMGLMAGTKTRVIGIGRTFYHIDLFYQKLHKNASLMSKNVHEDNNDVQIKNVFERYPELLERAKGFC